MDIPTSELNGERARLLRVSAGLTQRQVAEFLKVSHPSVSFWERGLRHPRPAVLRRYRALLSAWAVAIIEPSPVVDEGSK